MGFSLWAEAWAIFLFYFSWQRLCETEQKVRVFRYYLDHTLWFKWASQLTAFAALMVCCTTRHGELVSSWFWPSLWWFSRTPTWGLSTPYPPYLDNIAKIEVAACMLHGVWFGETAGARNLVLFHVKRLQPAMRGTSCVRRVRTVHFDVFFSPALSRWVEAALGPFYCVCVCVCGWCVCVCNYRVFWHLWLQIAV